MRYSNTDVNLILTSFWKGCQVLHEVLYPKTGIELFSDIRVVEFTDEVTTELKKYGAIGLAYPTRNINYVPHNLDRFTISLYTGVMFMELMHSGWLKITGDWRESNDVIHWLYNEGKLKKFDYVSQYNMKWFGGSILLVLPDVGYGLEHRKEIMEGIRTGKYKAGFNQYWSSPFMANQPMSAAISADKHELEHIKQFLIGH